MNQERLSKQAQALIQQRRGFRNESLSAGMFSLKEIIHFEIHELENEDILETCERLYGTTDYEEVIIQYFGISLEEKRLWGLWLATREDVLTFYAENSMTEVTMYHIPEHALILSDLGEEGVLFALVERPDRLFGGVEEIQGTLSYSERMKNKR